MAKRILTRRGWVAMTTRNVWLAVILLGAASVSLEIAVNGVDNTWLDFKSLIFSTLFSPFKLLAVVIVATACGAVGIWLADYKLRSSVEGFLLGFFLGPLGVVIEAALPDLGAYPRSELRAKGKG
jgi:hypothetical protein